MISAPLINIQTNIASDVASIFNSNGKRACNKHYK